MFISADNYFTHSQGCGLQAVSGVTKIFGSKCLKGNISLYTVINGIENYLLHTEN